ncbi:sugar phosphate isomerase/epimerase and 4-hydroxyphenylpyruvate domain-containing protein [Microvirga sp. 3-52]|uniref:bifunctional sugar phosphate isomerase/epimerase/4-hydroxyphenylpyruvate dioxygenase family protein n=1 Tax=Microvirga sp. 3-52 TaxID=2792425 RepID=UPI001AD3BFA7|nr:sugar phosphate isomerase/epimerase and 4-hydroxyphenylpyruvate domain-containing protein [Microvirga sp. 3-52]MBO1908675.1 sugar phosphate isomerase/epimerase and 4-hydroxyphenylpyruvate domain-containing protein [Microvirga sp. 3-52]MBS7455132.1 sugar phosphate isomerase/epimerase and 4-hydroxyphenylpyruvate domain-containing protein [Microvirga sp. 3-52]
MRTAIATVCLSGTLTEKIEAIAAAQFKGVEIFENDLLSFNGTPADARHMIEGLGLQTITFQPFRDFEGLPEPQRSKVFARAERKFDVMEELGCDLLMVCSNVSPESLGGIERAAADFHELGERAAKRGMRVAFEALSWGRHIHDYRDAWEVVRRASHPAVGLVLDSFHVLARGTDLSAIRSIPSDKIFLVQMADAPRLDMDYLSWSRHYRCFPGQGDLPVDAFMDALGATGFDGLLSLEIFNDRFRAGSARSVAIDGHRSLIVMLDELRRRTGAALPDHPVLPPKALCSGVEFVEFAVDERSAAGFEQTLRGLGFEKAGRHRSKAVTRWRQGGINIVVNADKEGFAHSFNITHGTSVCALALRVDDALGAVDRAVTLLDQPFQQPVGPDELNIPAVRGLGGSILYFVDHRSGLDRLWEVDFEPTDVSDFSGAGLVSVDHVSQSMHYEEMLTWLLFYSSLLDVRKTPVQTVLDPGGVVQSQAIETHDGSLRLILNASQSQRTLSSRFLNELFGSGIQHIALATDNLLAIVQRLKAGGVDLLPIPENYYDDLEVRTDLSAENVEQLRANNILYDREGGAEYFQVYTKTLEGGFFFEIVERRDYQGYGAINAPIRLASQTRLADTMAPQGL